MHKNRPTRSNHSPTVIDVLGKQLTKLSIKYFIIDLIMNISYSISIFLKMITVLRKILVLDLVLPSFLKYFYVMNRKSVM